MVFAARSGLARRGSGPEPPPPDSTSLTATLLNRILNGPNHRSCVRKDEVPFRQMNLALLLYIFKFLFLLHRKLISL